MTPATSQPELSMPPAGGATVQQPFSAARLMAGGLSLLLVLALALAAGVPAGQLLATVGGTSHGDTDRAVAPQVVERQERRLAQERPVPVGTDRFAGCGDRSNGPRCAGRSGVTTGSLLLRDALLALPPPALAA